MPTAPFDGAARKAVDAPLFRVLSALRAAGFLRNGATTEHGSREFHRPLFAPDMRLLCTLFGHRPAFGYSHAENEGHFTVKGATIDGMGRIHVELWCDCERCGTNYKAGNIHLPLPDARSLPPKLVDYIRQSRKRL